MENEKNENEIFKTPVSTIMDMAKQELETHVVNVMKNNHIPAGLMNYILDSVMNDIIRLQLDNINNELLQLQEELAGNSQDNEEE